MEINWVILSGVFTCAIALIVIIAKKNQKDKKKLERDLNKEESLFKDDESELNNER